MISFIPALWINFSLLLLSSFGLCFCRKFSFRLVFACLSVLAIVFNLSVTGNFMSDYNGQIIGLILIAIFGLQSFWLLYLSGIKQSDKIPSVFFAFPFLAVVLMAISRDVLSFFAALELFFVAFSGLFCFRYGYASKGNFLQTTSLVSFIFGAAGLWIVYLICGSLSLSQINTMLQDLSGRNQFLWIGIGLLSLDVMMKINMFSKTIKIKK